MQYFHKIHHLVKDPNCFGAYFVNYQSHILLEQLVVLIATAAGVPVMEPAETAKLQVGQK